MKIKDGFIIRQISDSYMAVPVGERTAEVHGVIALSETGAFLWKQLEEECEMENLVVSLLNEYDVDSERAKKDVSTYVDYLRSQGWLDE